jgi:hypothetical protein
MTVLAAGCLIVRVAVDLGRALALGLGVGDWPISGRLQADRTTAAPMSAASSRLFI